MCITTTVINNNKLLQPTETQKENVGLEQSFVQLLYPIYSNQGFQDSLLCESREKWMGECRLCIFTCEWHGDYIFFHWNHRLRCNGNCKWAAHSTLCSCSLKLILFKLSNPWNEMWFLGNSARVANRQNYNSFAWNTAFYIQYCILTMTGKLDETSVVLVLHSVPLNHVANMHHPLLNKPPLLFLRNHVHDRPSNLSKSIFQIRLV